MAVRVTGGIGDAVVAARWLRDLMSCIKCPCTLDIYFSNHRNGKFIFSAIPGLRAVYDDLLFEDFKAGYHVSFYINQFVDAWLGVDKTRVSVFDPFVVGVIAQVWRSRQTWKKYCDHHPHFDGAFADLAVLRGKARESFLHDFTGVPYTGPELSLALDESILDRHGLRQQPYITVHDGWDVGFNGLFSRPTKVLMTEDWPLLLGKIKKRSGLKIVQIGGGVGSTIQGVDLNLKGSLSLQQSVAVLKHAALHVDTESGLVHLAAAVGRRSLVFFGPTNASFFGYRENINRAPSYCGNCWWSDDYWMQRCPAGHETARCMQSHDLDDVADTVVREAVGSSAQPTA